MFTNNDKHNYILYQWTYWAHGRDALICIFICVSTKTHTFALCDSIVLRLYAKLLSFHGPNLTYCAIFLV